MSEYEEIKDLEVLELRKKVKELEAKLLNYEQILKDNDLLEQMSVESDTQRICRMQIGKLRELSDKGVPFTMEETKILEVLVKTMMTDKGKIIPEAEKKGKGKNHKIDVDNLLSIVGNKKNE